MWSKVQALGGIALDSAGHMVINAVMQHDDPLMGYIPLMVVHIFLRIPQHYCVLRVT
jgi:hypothetical protein